jgi:hypothetical protein
MPRARDPIETALAPRAQAGRAVAPRSTITTPALRCGARVPAPRGGSPAPGPGEAATSTAGSRRSSTAATRRSSGERIRDLIAAHEADEDPLNILPEIAALRALFQEFIERYDEQTEALIAWHLSWQLTKRPLPEEKVMAFEAIVEPSGRSASPRWARTATAKQKGDAESARAFIKLLRGEDAASRSPGRSSTSPTPTACWARSERWSSGSRRCGAPTRSAGPT